MTNKRGEKQTVLDLFNPKAQDRIDKRQTEKQLIQIIDHKNTQIGILHQINSRLGAQLAILQKKLGIDHDIILQELENINEISVAFHYELQQLQYLDSLLLAYDENSLKQKKLIAHLYSQLEDSEKKAQSLTKDNQFLITEMQAKSKQILQIYSKGFPEDNLVNAYSKLQRQTQIQMIENIREQNQYLLRHFNQMEDKARRLEKELNEAKKYGERYFNNFKEQSDELTNALIKVDDLSKIKQVLQKKFDEITQQNLQLQTLRQQLETKVNKLEQDHKMIKNQLQQQKRSNREEVQKINENMDTLKSQNQISQKRQRQYFHKNMGMQREITTLKEDNRALKRQIQKAKADFQQTLKMCQAYEIKINNYNKKQEYMKTMVDDSKERLDSALLERDKSILKEQQLQKFIQNMTEKHRQEMQTLKNTFQKIINSQNEKIKVLQENKQDYESTYHQNQCSLKHQIDKIKRENTMLKEENQKHVHNIRNTSGNEIVSKLKELQDKNQSLSRMLSQKERIMRDEVEHRDQMLRNLQNQNRDLARQVDKERLNARQALNERTQLKSKISISEKEKQCLQQEITRLKRTLDSRSHSMNEEKQWKMKQLQQRLNQSLSKEKDTRMKAIEMLEKYDKAQQQLKLEYQSRIDELEAENRKLRKKLKK